MNRLFILGNGFDISHGLPTKYQHFHEYLLEMYPEAKDHTPIFNISSTTANHGEEIFEHKEVVAFLMHVISNAEEDGDYWCNIETSLGYLDFGEFFDDISDLFENDDDFDEDEPRLNEDSARNFRMATETLSDYFSEWVESIDVSETESKDTLEDLIATGNNIFLNFNYTRVVEEVYNANRVVHIHGVEGGELILGHGVDRDFEDSALGARDELEELHEMLRKQTNNIIRKYEDFFNQLSGINEIYSIGFSFSEVDLPYIKRICESMDTSNVVWYLSTFGTDEEHAEYKDKIIKCDFKGEFGWFTL